MKPLAARWHRVSLRLAAIWFGASLLALAGGMIWMTTQSGYFYGVYEQLMGTAALHAVASMLVFASLLLAPGHPRPALPGAAVMLLIAASVVMTLAIWEWIDPGTTEVFILWTLVFLSLIAFLAASLFRTAAMHPVHVAARVISMLAMVGSASCMAAIGFLTLGNNSGNSFGVFIFLMLLGLSCTVLSITVGALGEIIAIARRRRARRAEFAVALDCPKCGARQSLHGGITPCSSCRARIQLRVEEPRCECGYLLFELTGNNCPECGRELPADSRWSVESVPA